MKQVPITFDPRVNEFEGTRTDEQGFLYKDGLTPGAAHFASGRSGDELIPNVVLRFSCPCGCGAVGALPINKQFNPQAWTWNGSTEKPTCTPSIQMLTKCRWHGYLTNGVFAPC